MTDIEKLKKEIVTARSEVTETEKEISRIRFALRELASSTTDEGGNTDANSLKVSVTKVCHFYALVLLNVGSFLESYSASFT